MRKLLLATISGGRPPTHRLGDAVGSLQLGPNVGDKVEKVKWKGLGVNDHW